ncbi:MAG: WYL domain-containing transcriptional regulator [Spirochaetales bacterium]|nr:WYL domain-containing transcriptional regulator [Candidatus Physcosoma equi]
MKGERVAQLELLLRSHPEGLRRAEIARRLGVHRSTISRYVDELAQYIDVYEDNNLIKIQESEDNSPMELSIYESLAFNMSAEVLASSASMQNPHLASGLRKIAMNMRSYAPKISDNILQLADKIESSLEKTLVTSDNYNTSLEVLIDCWVSGRLARITTSTPEREEIEIAPYFIGFTEDLEGRKPMTVTGRLRHTKDIITLNIATITNVQMLNETYTIPDNLKPFTKQGKEESYDAIDMVPLVMKVSEKSALNSFSTLVHDKPMLKEQEDGTMICSMRIENSIELYLRLVQCGTSVTILEPESFKTKYVGALEKILALYK